MHKKDIAIAAAKKHATEWSVPWGMVTGIGKWRSWWRFFAVSGYLFVFETDYGNGQVEVSCPSTVIRFEFFPTDSDHWMVPLWAAYPCYNAITIGWRMGDGEVYKYRWYDWYRGLSDEKRSEYKARFTPPDDGLGWNDYYDDIADVPGDRESIVDLIMGRVPANDA